MILEFGEAISYRLIQKYRSPTGPFHLRGSASVVVRQRQPHQAAPAVCSIRSSPQIAAIKRTSTCAGCRRVVQDGKRSPFLCFQTSNAAVPHDVSDPAPLSKEQRTSSSDLIGTHRAQSKTSSVYLNMSSMRQRFGVCNASSRCFFAATPIPRTAITRHPAPAGKTPPNMCKPWSPTKTVRGAEVGL